MHENHHIYKDVDKRSDLKKKDFYNYTYKTDTQRVSESVKANKDMILEK